MATPSYITVFDYAWSSPLTSSINQPRNIPLPSGGKVDMFSSLDSNGGAYAVVDGSSLFWVPIAR